MGAAVDMGADEFVPTPAVNNFIINDGAAQRSMVDSVTVVFNQPVTLAAGAITLAQLTTTPGVTTPVAFTLSNPTGDSRTYVLTFNAPNDLGGSLPNGSYTLTVHSLLVQSTVGSTSAGSDQTYTFHRLFGDYYGTGTVNFADLLLEFDNLGAREGSVRYLWYMDPTGSGSISFASLLGLFDDLFKKSILD
jgi:hypothetical protein